jgi:hypothetical protein
VPAINCPHCQTNIVLTIGIEGREDARPKTAPREIQTFIQDMEEAGVIRCFTDVVKGRGISLPNNLPRFFIHVAATLTPMTLPPVIMQRIAAAFGPPLLYHSNGYVFLVRGRSIVAMTSIETIREIRPASARVDFTDDWIKTKFGYLTSPYLLDDFKRRAIGAWDITTGMREKE